MVAGADLRHYVSRYCLRAFPDRLPWPAYVDSDLAQYQLQRISLRIHHHQGGQGLIPAPVAFGSRILIGCTRVAQVPLFLPRVPPRRRLDDGPGDFTQAALMCAHVALAGCAHPFQRAYRLQYVRGWPALYDLKPVTAFPLRSVRA